MTRHPFCYSSIYPHAPTGSELTVFEVEAINSRGRAREGSADSILPFRKNGWRLLHVQTQRLATGMGGRVGALGCWEAILEEHLLQMHPTIPGLWLGNELSTARQTYQKLP